MDDMEAIKKLEARYFRALDSKDWDLCRSVCSPRIASSTTAAATASASEGTEAFMAYVTGLTILQSVHHGHMPKIDLTGPTTATGVWAMEDYNIWEDGHQNHGLGHSLETYEKQGDRWTIKTMKLSYLRIETECGKAAMIAGPEGRGHLRGVQPALEGMVYLPTESMMACKKLRIWAYL